MHVCVSMCVHGCLNMCLMCVCDAGGAALCSKLRLGIRLRGPTSGLGRPRSAGNKADAKDAHAADWV